MQPTPLTILKSARAFLSDPSHWCRCSLFLESNVSDVGYCCCLEGALLLGDGAKFHNIDHSQRSEEWKQARDLLASIIQKKSDNLYDSVVSFNDDRTTTHAQVLSLLDEVIASLEPTP